MENQNQNQNQNEIYLESINTPLLNLNHKKLPRNHCNHRNTKKNPKNINNRNLLSKFYYYLKKIFPCCYKYKEVHLCYFQKFEDRIIIKTNSFVKKASLSFIFWDQNYEEEEVFFNEDEQKIINRMKEEIKNVSN